MEEAILTAGAQNCMCSSSLVTPPPFPHTSISLHVPIKPEMIIRIDGSRGFIILQKDTNQLKRGSQNLTRSGLFVIRLISKKKKERTVKDHFR